ncbi:hypothetical protein [Maritimibacter dapengensis]|uniref:DUF4229 domain-containing protein n=1 Tax=Maritimibacter dapengensis TaxID=2836868 RepID=A0ABS6T007_9RHOB|nr:hypothetical protein [Maritimibacter dapengensis]MBV7377717.1 hypothetical protein [Maritimibacter dapengensis]
MTDDQHTDRSGEVRAQLDAVEAQLPTTRSILTSWAIRVAIVAALIYAIIQWRETDMTWFLPLAAIYAAVSLILAFIMRGVQVRSFEKQRQKMETMLNDMDRHDD